MLLTAAKTCYTVSVGLMLNIFFFFLLKKITRHIIAAPRQGCQPSHRLTTRWFYFVSASAFFMALLQTEARTKEGDGFNILFFQWIKLTLSAPRKIEKQVSQQWLVRCKLNAFTYHCCRPDEHQVDIMTRKSFYSISVTAQYFIIFWAASSGAVHAACEYLFITNYTPPMQSHLYWNIHEAEWAHKETVRLVIQDYLC